MSRHGLLPWMVLLVLGACCPEKTADSEETIEPPAAESDAESAEALAVFQVNEALLPQVEGQEVSAGNFPEFSFAAAVGGSPFALHCGGALIAEDWVLTAAHCARDKALLLGNHDLEGNDGELHQIRANQWFCHRPRNLESLENDIALIKLDRNPPVGGSGITPVPLVRNNRWETRGRMVTLLGWGTGVRTKGLHHLEASLQGPAACSQSFSDQVPAQTFCTIHATNEAGPKDSGGPVTIELNGQRTLVGIMVAVGGLTANGTPNRHLRLTPYLPWINRVITGRARSREFDHCPP